jgi:hypothetical protein
MIVALYILLATPCPAGAFGLTVSSDTIRLEVGSKEVNGRVYAPHAARVRVHVGSLDTPPTAEWTNELTLGDSAGRRVMRWVTKGTRTAPNGGTTTWELRQTYDAVTLAPYGYHARSSNGAFTQLTLEGTRVRGTKRVPGDTTVQQVDVTLDRPGFVASASDLVPTAVGLKEGNVITAPFWNPARPKSELRIFTVLGQVSVNVEGTDVTSWKVEERRYSDRQLLATWYLVDKSPYMVYGEVPLPNGQTQRMTEVAIPTKTGGAGGSSLAELRYSLPR